MDKILLDKIKEVTSKYKPVYTCNIFSALIDIQKRIDELINELFKVKYESVTDSIDYINHYNLLKSIKDLGQIILVLVNEQERNIFLTNDALFRKDNSMYFLNKERNLKILSIIDELSLNSEINEIINKRKEVYLGSFGYFKSREAADSIIKKEFHDIEIYIDMLRKFNKLKYEEFDNYDVLISLCQNIMYELCQLYIVIMEASESNIYNSIIEAKKNNEDCYFIIMDFVNSKSLYPDKLYELVEFVQRINYIIAQEKDINLLCNMDMYKQDEIHSILIGDIEKFISIIEKYSPYDLKLGYGKINLNSEDSGLVKIEETVFNIPFIFSGPSTWEARDNITNSPKIIRHR